jgi:hypothetical protein
VDITRGAYGIFVKYTAGWMEWAGIKKFDSLVKPHSRGTHRPLFHPTNENLAICCNKTDVLWISRASLGGARGELFRRRPSQSIISAREMIEATTVLAKKIDAMYNEERKRLRIDTPLASLFAINVGNSTARCHCTGAQAETSTTLPMVRHL